MAKYWDPPPFSPKFFFNQNDSEWPEMYFKHNFKNCNILSVGPPSILVSAPAPFGFRFYWDLVGVGFRGFGD